MRQPARSAIVSFASTYDVIEEEPAELDEADELWSPEGEDAMFDIATLGPGPFVQIVESIEAPSSEQTFYLVRIRKSRVESRVEIADPIHEIRLDRSTGGRLGLRLEVHLSTQSLFIKEILGGLAFVWNSRNPDFAMRPGDRIVRVNGLEGDAQAMNAECKKNQVLDLGVYKSTVVPMTAGVKATCMQGFDNLRCGYRGTVRKVDEEGDALIKFPNIGNQWVCRTDYDKFNFEDGERFFLKRYSDFRDLWTLLRSQIDGGTIKVLTKVPEMPLESSSSGFKLRLSAGAAQTLMNTHRDGLQKYLRGIMDQLERIEAEPAVAAFFGTEAVPDVDPAIKEHLEERLEFLSAQYRAEFARKIS